MSLGYTLSAVGISSNRHSVVVKRNFKSKTCSPCGKRIKFLQKTFMCTNCPSISHPRCSHVLSQPCVPYKYPDESSKPMVPALLQLCVNEIEKRPQKDLYKIPSPDYNKSHKIYKRFLRRKAFTLKVSVHILAESIKIYLLHQPIIPSWHLQGMNQMCDNEERLINAFMQLPKPNRDTLAFFLLHLSHIMQTPRVRLSRDDLVVIFSPYITEGHRCTMEALMRISATFWQQSVLISSVKKEINRISI